MTQQTAGDTNIDQKLHGLDHLRALAITLVFFYHYRMFGHPEWVDTVAGFGWTGVDLFFVLSGFLISSQLFRQLDTMNTIRLKEFFTKRFFRIIPPYLLVVALYFCLPFFREREALPPLWRFLTFTQNFGLDVINKGTFSHAWSLCIEEQFYLTLPFLLLFFYRAKLLRYSSFIIIFFLLIIVGFRLFSWFHFIEPNVDTDDFWLQWYKWLYYPTYTRLDGLLIGVSIAAIMRHSSKIKNGILQSGNLIFFIGLVISALAYFICRDQYSFQASIFGFLIVAVGYGFVVASAISLSSFLYQTKSFITAQIAGLSYAIYLSHKGVIHLTQASLEKLGLENNGNFTLLLCIISSLSAGLILRYIIERPSLLIRNYLLKILGNSER